ncbi:right-handed parallel beta-helix repeat-containing protein [bacterium]|nr:right-handed parallel beta-helix repeat-containing protein [bacterium]
MRTPVPRILFVLVFLCAVPALAVVKHVYVDDNATPPGNGSLVAPYPNISTALIRAVDYQPGDVLHIHLRPGEYREKVSKAGWLGIPADLIIEGDLINRPVIKGSVTLSDWTAVSANEYVTDWPYDLFEGYPAYNENDKSVVWWYYGNDPDNSYRAEYVSRWESVWVDGQRLTQILTTEEAGPGTFLVDQTNDKLYVWLEDGGNPEAHTVEAAVRPQGLNFVRMNSVTLENLVVQHAKTGILATQTANITVNNCLVRDNVEDGIAVSLMDSFVANNTVATRNGYNGIQPSFSLNLDFVDVSLTENNWRGYHVNAGNWQVAGMKLYGVANVMMDNVTAADNLTSGIWFDRYSDSVDMANCTMEDNYGSGLFWEISPGPIELKNCTFRNNGLGLLHGDDLSTTYSGLLINSGANLRAERCTFETSYPYNVRIANSGRRADLWKDGEEGVSEPIDVLGLVFDHCTFSFVEPDSNGIFVPEFLDPDWMWENAITIIDDADSPAAPDPGQFYDDYAFNLSPNPSINTSLLSIELPDVADINVRLFDVLGRQVSTMTHRQVQPGLFRTPVDVSRLASGAYFLSVRAGGDDVGMRKLVVVK